MQLLAGNCTRRLILGNPRECSGLGAVPREVGEDQLTADWRGSGVGARLLLSITPDDGGHYTLGSSLVKTCIEWCHLTSPCKPVNIHQIQNLTCSQ